MLISVAVCILLMAQGPDPGEWGDQRDGSFVNPIMPGDFSDLDAIRNGDDYYAITSTNQFSPGMAVLHSKDLVNWQIIGHAVKDLTQIGPELNWDRMNRAGKGIWAGSIRYHEGKYRIYFGTPDEGLFMTSAVNPAGPWDAPRVVKEGQGWDDPCPFWDDDGQGYVVASKFSDSYKIHLFKSGDSGWDRVIHQSRGSEANKLYKFDGLYYHLFSHVTGEGRVVMMERAKSLEGPWEERQIGHVNAAVDREPNQGALVQIPSGAWWFVTHQGKGEWEGRPGNLLPVRWVDGWPMIGRMQWRLKKPLSGFAVSSLFTSDDFSGAELKPEWEWNYQPRRDYLSLSERPGFLRLRAFKPLRKGDFGSVGNILTQRSRRGARNQVTVKLDLAGMEDGLEAGLAHFAKTSCRIGVLQSGTARMLTSLCDGRPEEGPAVSSTTLWLRSEWNFAGLSQFFWSVDGHKFTAMGDAYQLTWGAYRGDRIGLYSFNEVTSRGFVDFDSFSYN